MEKYGNNGFIYEHVSNWGQVPEGLSLSVVAGICINSHDHIYILSRSRPAIVIFNKDGSYLGCWDNSEFVRAHGMYIDEKDNIFCVDDGAHVVYKFNKDRKQLMMLGNKEKPSDTGIVTSDWRVERSGDPFNRPTDIAISRNKDMYITDGYGNARVHKFNADGILEFSWGDPGDKPGQFYLPHGIVISNKDIIYVADRENGRIQLFTLNGEFIEEWNDLLRPAALFIDKNNLLYVGECKRSATFDGSPTRVAIFDLEGNLLARLENPNTIWPGLGQPWRAVHGLCVDSEGSIYVAEVGKKSPANYVGVHKYRRV